MKIEYFSDTDTLLLEFSENMVEETRDLNENTLVEFDSGGKLVSMTIEHAKEQANMEEFVFHPGQSTGHGIYKVAEKAPQYKAREDAE
ncbi:MAG: DUF2283 domain-containing protein [Verrucomicrobiota bacterium]